MNLAIPPRTGPWLVLLVQAGFVGALYAPTLALTFMSDAWEMLEQARHGLWPALTTTIGYHYIPVAGAFTALSWALLGTNDVGYQVVNLLLHIAVGHLSYRLALRLTNDLPLAFFASLLFLGSAALHEVTFWPVVGAVQSLSAIFYVLGLATVLGMSATRSTARSSFVLALCLGAALFTYEGMVTLLPVAVVLLVRERFDTALTDGRASWRDRRAWRGLALALAPSLAVIALLMAAQRVFAAQTARAVQLDFSMERAYWLARGLVSTFSLRGSHDSLHAIVTLGAGSPPGLQRDIFVAGWLLLALVLLVVAITRSRSRLLTVASVWLLVHLVVISIPGPIVSRRSYVAAIPAAWLTALALRSIGIRLSRGRSGYLGAMIGLAPLVVGSGLLWWGARGELQTAAAVWGRASEAVRGMVAGIRRELATRPAPTRLTLVNVPARFALRGFGAYVLANGTRHMMLMLSDRRIQVELRGAGVRNSGGLATGTATVPFSELCAVERDRRNPVLLFDEGHLGFRRLSDLALERYTPTSAPLLGWRDGSWPWFLVPVSSEREFLLRAPAPESWVAIRYAGRQSTRFGLRAGRSPLTLVTPPPLPGVEHWVASTWPLRNRRIGEIVPVLIAPQSPLEVAYLWAFAPVPRYDAASAPFLPWTQASDGSLFLPVVGEMRLPLAGAGGTVTIEYLAERRRELWAGSDEATGVDLHASERPMWTTARVPIPADARALVLRQKGEWVPMLRSASLTAR